MVASEPFSLATALRAVVIAAVASTDVHAAEYGGTLPREPEAHFLGDTA
jgi:hypothetical protein